MADTSIFSTPHNATDNKNGLHGTFWADENNGVAICADNGADLTKLVTSNGGTSFTATEIQATNIKKLACFPDWAVPGDTGTLVHVAWLDVDNSDLYYVTVDASDGSHGTIRTVSSTLTVATTDVLNILGITKTKSGNIIIAGSTQTELFAFKSTDNFASSNVSIATPMEDANQEDHIILLPANTSDNNDASCLFWDRSANEISLKKYDDSADSWASETSVATGMTDYNTPQHFGAAVRHSDSHIIACGHNAIDSAGDDILCWDINPADTVTVTSLTNVFTDQAESAVVGIAINQQNDDIYVAYMRGTTWGDSVSVYYKVSTDDGSTWSSETAISENAEDDLRVIGTPISISDNGGRWQPVFYNDDTTDHFINLNTEVVISAVVAGPAFRPRMISF